MSNSPRENTQDVAQLFAQAVACHNAGAHAQTQALCVQLLRRQPNHFDALHLLGVSQYTTQDFVTAEKVLKHAVALAPRTAAAHYHLGLVQFALKQFNAACVSYEMAIAVQPNFAVRSTTSAMRATRSASTRARLESLQPAVALDGGYAEVFYNRGAVLARLERYDEALASFDQALRFSPAMHGRSTGAAQCSSICAAMLKRIASFDRALAIKAGSRERACAPRAGARQSRRVRAGARGLRPGARARARARRRLDRPRRSLL